MTGTLWRHACSNIPALELLFLFVIIFGACRDPVTPADEETELEFSLTKTVYTGDDVLFMFDGANDRTFEYDIERKLWTEYTDEAGTAPNAYCDFELVYTGDDTVVLFGGYKESTSESYDTVDETWEYNLASHSWSEVSIGGGQTFREFSLCRSAHRRRRSPASRR